MDRNRTTYKLFSIVLAAVILFSAVSFVTSAQDDKIATMLRQYMAETNEPLPITVLWADPPTVVTYENKEAYLNDRTIIELKMQGEDLLAIWEHLHGVNKIEIYDHSEEEIDKYLKRPEVIERIDRWANSLCVMDAYLPFLRERYERYKDYFTTTVKYDYYYATPKQFSTAEQYGTATPEQIEKLSELDDVYLIEYGISIIVKVDGEPKAFTCLMGDVDGDGDITANDARLVLRLAAKLDPGEPISEGNANVVVDGKITAEDAMVILRKSAKLPIYTQNCPYEIYI
ncbi:MAG: dockerin type I repeat-containing protein [Clostridia bacterium]|nr:dockerin type I repeat-containing protein [Clostridia bacterium]MBQ9879789.1 dockerin type I repeat-containing protein [Clostridia bacterium]